MLLSWIVPVLIFVVVGAARATAGFNGLKRVPAVRVWRMRKHMMKGEGP